MGIMDMIKDVAADKIKDTLMSEGIMDKVVKFALPIIMSAIMKNLKNGNGIDSFISALGDHETDDDSLVGGLGDSIFDKIKNADIEDGGKIAKHIFGGESLESLTSKIADTTGISKEQGMDMISSVAPSVMEMIANNTKGNRSVESVEGVLKEQLDSMDTGNIMDMIGDFLQ